MGIAKMVEADHGNDLPLIYPLIPAFMRAGVAGLTDEIGHSLECFVQRVDIQSGIDQDHRDRIVAAINTDHELEPDDFELRVLEARAGHIGFLIGLAFAYDMLKGCAL
jgi:hypothetical protein